MGVKIKNGNEKCPQCKSDLIPIYKNGVRYLKCFKENCDYIKSDIQEQIKDWG